MPLKKHSVFATAKRVSAIYMDFLLVM